MNPGNVACILTLHFTEIDKNFFYLKQREREKKILERIISLVENGMSSKKPRARQGERENELL